MSHYFITRRYNPEYHDLNFIPPPPQFLFFKHLGRMIETRIPKLLCQYEPKVTICQGRVTDTWRNSFKPCNQNMPTAQSMKLMNFFTMSSFLEIR
jgi:hypothetical protein